MINKETKRNKITKRTNDFLFDKIILLFGKSGAGKSSVGEYMAEKINGLHISMGDFIRDYLKTNPPKENLLKNEYLFQKLAKFIKTKKKYRYFILACNPYPQDCLEELLDFIRVYSKECFCFEIFINNQIALSRNKIEKHGDNYQQRLLYYKNSIKPALLRFNKFYKIKKIKNYKSLKSTAEKIIKISQVI